MTKESDESRFPIANDVLAGAERSINIEFSEPDLKQRELDFSGGERVNTADDVQTSCGLVVGTAQPA